MQHQTASVDTLNSIVEFDCPFYVADDGNDVGTYGVQATVETCLADVHAPEVFHVEGQQSPNDVEIQGPWVRVTGYSGQHGYSGPVMHASEFLGGGMARDVLSQPGVYVVTEVMVLEHDDTCGDGPNAIGDCSGGHEPAGWILLRFDGETL